MKPKVIASGFVALVVAAAALAIETRRPEQVAFDYRTPISQQNRLVLEKTIKQTMPQSNAKVKVTVTITDHQVATIAAK